MKLRFGGAIAGAAGSIALLTLASRLIGFIRVWIQNGVLGTTVTGDAYTASNTVPNVLFEVAAGGALAGAVIPLISGFLAKKMEREASQTVSALLTWILAIGLPLAAIVALAAEPIMSVLLQGDASATQVAVASTLLRMFALQIPLYGISVVLTGVLQAHRKFILPAVAPLLSSLVVVGVFLVFGDLAQGFQDHPEGLSALSLAWLGWGTTAGVIVFSLPQLVPVMRLMALRPTFRFPEGIGRRAVKLMGAGLGALVAQQVQIVVIMMVANAHGGKGATGAYSVYYFANAVYMVPYAVLAVPIATAVFPRLSAAAALPGRPGMAQLTARSTRLVMDVGVVCVALLAVMAVPVQQVFDVLRPAKGLDVALVAMAPGLVGYALIYHCSRVLYALEASRTVVIVNSVAWLSVCAILGVCAATGLDGRASVLTAIGISISGGMTIGAIGHVMAIRSVVGQQATAGFLRSLVLVSAGTALSAAAGYGVVHVLLSALGTGLIGALVAAMGGAVVIVGGGFGSIYLFDRASLALTDAR